MSLASLDEKLFAFYYFMFFENKFLSTDSRDIKRPPFDATHQGESNELRFVIFRSWIGEIMRFEIWPKMKISPDFENFDMQKCQGVSSSNGHRDFYYSSSDSS